MGQKKILLSLFGQSSIVQISADTSLSETSSRQQRIHDAFGASWRNPAYIQNLELISKPKAGILDGGIFVVAFLICLAWEDLKGFVCLVFVSCCGSVGFFLKTQTHFPLLFFYLLNLPLTHQVGSYRSMKTLGLI